MKKIIYSNLIVLALLLNVRTAFAQAKIGNNINSINSNSLLELESTNKGLLLPRIALTATNSASPLTAFVAGMVVYNTATAGTSPYNVVPGYYYSDGTNWLQVQSAPVQNYDWRKSGNNNPNSISDTTTPIYHMGQVGIGTNSNNNSALLQLNSTTKGFLPPRMTSTDISKITAPLDGLTIYNTTLGCMGYFRSDTFRCFDKNAFVTLSPPVAQQGNAFTAFYNGYSGGTYSVGGASSTTITHTAGESFSNSTTCSSKYISSTGCGGLTTVTGTSGTVYSLVNINGQCWTTTNMKEVPSKYAYHTTTSWLNTSTPDSGYFGFYNTTTTNGSAGWATTEPAAGEGFLYQWSAAMNGDTAERSRGVCPSGFHIPSDCEYMYLEHGLGCSLSNQNSKASASTRCASSNVGSKLSSYASSGNNVSGFSTLISGYRYFLTGEFLLRTTTSGTNWSSTKGSSTTAYQRAIYVAYAGVARNNNDFSFAFAIRCLKD